MNSSLGELLGEIEAFGKINDASVSDRSQRMLNITRDTGEFLALLVNAMNARNILEIGTSNGYSTLWLAMAASRIGGTVSSVECAEHKVAMAGKNFERSGLAPYIRQIHGDAGNVIRTLGGKTFDLLFLDSERSEYVGWWPCLKALIRDGGLLLVDNATSHAGELQAFFSLVTTDDRFTTSLVPIGNGEFLASRLAKRALA